MLCCRVADKEDHNFNLATHRLYAELDVKRIVKTLRYLKSATKLNTTAEDRKLLRMQANYRLVRARDVD